VHNFLEITGISASSSIGTIGRKAEELIEVEYEEIAITLILNSGLLHSRLEISPCDLHLPRSGH